MNDEKRITVRFHIGRGGRFYNPGSLSYEGECSMEKLLSLEDANIFLQPENCREIQQYIADKGEEARDVYDKCVADNNFKDFEKLSGIVVKEEALFDSNMNLLLTAEELKKETGTLNFDNDYDKDYIIYLDECTDIELSKIIEEGDTRILKIYGEHVGFSSKDMEFMEKFERWNDLIDCVSGEYIDENYIETDEDDWSAKEIGGKYYIAG